MKRFYGIFFVVSLTVLLSGTGYSQKFIHPGINQTSEDLAYMKKQVQAGAQPGV